MAESIRHLEKGWAKWYEFTKAANQSALDHFSRAAAHAIAAKAWAHFENYDNEWVDDIEQARRAGIACAAEAAALLPANEDPDDYRIHWVCGYACFNDDNHDEALKSYNKAIGLSRQGSVFDYELLAEMANLHICAGRANRAVSDLETAISNDAQLRDFYLDYQGWALLEDGKYEEAITKLRAIESIKEEFKVLLATAHAKIGDEANDDLAKATMDEIISDNPEFNLSDHEQSMRETWHYQDKDHLAALFEELHDLGYP
jgi:tetratricopeptide (TPR) repeat protein